MVRVLVLLLALAMPVVSWMSQEGWFGGDIGSVSNRYPSLIVAAGHAFAIWGLIFALSIGYALWQVMPARRGDVLAKRLAWPVAGVFALTSAWMIVFPQQIFWLALLVIWASLALLLAIVWRIAPAPRKLRGIELVLVRWTFLVFCAWVALAAFLNIAQTLLAYRIDPGVAPVVWSTALLVLAAVLLLWVNRRVQGDIVFTATAWWALLGIWVKQSASAAPGAHVTAWTAIGIAAVLLVHTLWLRFRRRR